MNLRLQWLEPFDLSDGSIWGYIYEIEDLNFIPSVPGVYVFGRVHGQSVTPLYIGKARNLRRRVEQELKGNVRLMRGIEDAPAGYRTLHVAQLVRQNGQKLEKALRTIESALISAAHVEGFDLINIQGTKTLVHTITSVGNREARRWLPENTIKLRRA